jgi:hypothetical protein
MQETGEGFFWIILLVVPADPSTGTGGFLPNPDIKA